MIQFGCRRARLALAFPACPAHHVVGRAASPLPRFPPRSCTHGCGSRLRATFSPAFHPWRVSPGSAPSRYSSAAAVPAARLTISLLFLAPPLLASATGRYGRHSPLTQLCPLLFHSARAAPAIRCRLASARVAGRQACLAPGGLAASACVAAGPSPPSSACPSPSGLTPPFGALAGSRPRAHNVRPTASERFAVRFP